VKVCKKYGEARRAAIPGPQQLRQAFSGLGPASATAPRRVDEAIARAARTRLGSMWLRRLRWWLPPAAAAAFLVWLLLHTTALPGDVDGNGRIDILDAFALARRLEAGPVTDRRLDVTGEGIVDRLDVKAIAQRAVALDGDGR
jgi:hypothetical protein